MAATTDADEARLAVAEERLIVGKREISRGGVRVRRVVTEVPVEEQVVLRDETIRVDRRSVDQPVSGTDANLFTEQTFEFSETDEEAVITKEARVVEEVVVGPDVVAVTLLGPDLEPTRATLVDSVAVAWWPGSVDRAATVRLRLSDGTQRELLLTDVLVTDPGELRVIEVEPGTEETDGMVTIIDG